MRSLPLQRPKRRDRGRHRRRAHALGTDGRIAAGAAVYLSKSSSKHSHSRLRRLRSGFRLGNFLRGAARALLNRRMCRERLGCDNGRVFAFGLRGKCELRILYFVLFGGDLKKRFVVTVIVLEVWYSDAVTSRATPNILSKLDAKIKVLYRIFDVILMLLLSSIFPKSVSNTIIIYLSKWSKSKPTTQNYWFKVSL